MDKILWTEIKRFIKRNYKKAIVISLVIGLIYTLVTNIWLRPEENLTVDESSDITEELADYYTGFQVYIEYDDGRSFTNTTLLEEYVIQPAVVEEAEAGTGIEILSRMEELEETGFEKEGQNRGVLGVIRGGHSNIFTILVNVGTNLENMEVAEYYYDELTSGNVNFLENKDIYVWSEPQLIEDPDREISENGNLVGGVDNNMFTDYLLDMTIGTVFGLVVTSLLVLLWSLLRDGNLYSFSYNRGSEDVFLLYNPSAGNHDEIAQLIAYPLNHDKIIIHNTNIPENLKSALEAKLNTPNKSSNISYVTKMSEASIISERTEIVIMLNSNQDSKKWYRAQRKLADTYQFPVKVVQINS